MPKIVRKGKSYRLHREMCMTNAFNVSNSNSVFLFAPASLTTQISYTVILRKIMHFNQNACLQLFIFSHGLFCDLYFISCGYHFCWRIEVHCTMRNLFKCVNKQKFSFNLNKNENTCTRYIVCLMATIASNPLETPICHH